jgi:hypothetical protein
MASSQSKTPKPWDRRIAKQGDGSKKTTFAAMGQALSNWTELELKLASLFATLVTSADHTMGGPMLAFGSIRTFEGRSEMLQSAAMWFFNRHKSLSEASRTLEYSPSSISNWQQAFEELRRTADQFASRRNDIAHGVVNEMPRSRKRRAEFALRPLFIEPKKYPLFSGDPKFMYSSRELLYYASEFEKLCHTAAVLNAGLRGMLREHRRASLERTD